jgi:hypothetical protein
MENVERFEDIKNSKDSEKINDFLIELGKNPRIEYISFLEYFIENCDPQIIQQIKLNLVYNLGEFGKLEKINKKFVEYLVEEYYNSDRWIRNEIISAFGKITKNFKLSDDIVELIGKALNEDYLPLKVNALNTLTYIENLPNSVLKNIFNVLNSSNSELIDISTNILLKAIKNEDYLFDLLYRNENYKILKKKAIRSLLVIFFKSVTYLESFREKLLRSEMDSDYKEMFFSEINTYERILLKLL